MVAHVHLIAFLGVAVVLVVTPGVDTALVTKNALLYGRPQAIASALGVNLGIVLWTLASALGLAAVVRASAATFDVLKLAGAIYLVIVPGGSVLTASLLLGGVFNLMGIAWLCSYALAASRARSFLRHSVLAQWLERISGAVLVALGIRLATEHR